jgi:hypothetical protein
MLDKCKGGLASRWGHCRPLIAEGTCLVLVIEWQLRWTNMCLSGIHRWLVHRYLCDEGAHCLWVGMDSKLPNSVIDLYF